MMTGAVWCGKSVWSNCANEGAKITPLVSLTGNLRGSVR